MEKFEAAVEKDPKHALAHYNLACTRGVLCAGGKSDRCHEISRPKILEALKDAIKSKPDLAKGAVKDADLKQVRDTFYFQTSLLGLSLNKDVPKLLLNVAWYSRRGTMPLIIQMKFSPGGKLLFTTGQMDESDGSFKKAQYRGTYQVNGLTVEVELAGSIDGKKKFTGKLGHDGNLVFPDELGTFNDAPAECAG